MVKISRYELGKLRSFSTVKRWLRDKLPRTQYVYLRNLEIMRRATDLDPDQFLAWAKTRDSLEVWDRIEEVAEDIPGPGARFNFKTDMRSFLAHNGYNNLPKAKNGYTVKEWHRGYRKEELRKLIGYLDTPIHKLFVYLALESGLRANTVLALRYKHIKEDLEAGLVPVALRLGPEYYGKKKSAGFTFLGDRSLTLLKECMKKGLVKTDPDSPLIPSIVKGADSPGSYSNMHEVLVRAAGKAGLDKSIQPMHGLRKYFENALDHAGIDSEQKQMIEGHFEGVRAKAYTDRQWDTLRPLYSKAYPHIDVDAGDPELAEKLVSWQEEKRHLTERIYALEEEKKERNHVIPEVLDELKRLKKEIEDLKKQK